jgi:hypothetical protein
VQLEAWAQLFLHGVPASEVAAMLGSTLKVSALTAS